MNLLDECNGVSTIGSDGHLSWNTRPEDGVDQLSILVPLVFVPGQKVGTHTLVSNSSKQCTGLDGALSLWIQRQLAAIGPPLSAPSGTSIKQSADIKQITRNKVQYTHSHALIKPTHMRTCVFIYIHTVYISVLCKLGALRSIVEEEKE